MLLLCVLKRESLSTSTRARARVLRFSTYVCVYVREGACSVRACVHVCERLCVHACERACVRACTRASVRAIERSYVCDFIITLYTLQ